MSRIEQALEKAALLRNTHGNNSTKMEGDRDASMQPVQQRPLPPVLDGSELKVQIENPLIATLCDPHSPISEEYRKLKSTIAASVQQDVFRNAIMVTSTVGGEGKSITSLNLAITLAQEFDHTVLLVDADLRKPSLQDYLGMKPGKGLSDYLNGASAISDLLIKTDIGRLTLLPAGTPLRNPVELFSSQKMKEFVAEIKSRYPDRFIIIDTPPVLPFAETRSLGALVDGVVFVIREGRPTLENVGEAINSLDRKKMLGFVYNEATVQSLNGRYHYYYHGYGYGKETPENRRQAADRGPETRDQRPGIGNILTRMLKRGRV
jgi:protein-tyrosine kinase